MSFCRIEFWSYDVAPENRQAVAETMSKLFELTSYTEPDVPGLATATTAEIEPAPAKPKRTRRTKAQIAADKVKEADAAAAALGEQKGEVVPPAEDENPLADSVEYTEQNVKDAVIMEMDRLKEAGYENPGRAVVEKLIVLTGKDKVNKIDASQYGVVINGLSAS